MTIVAILSVDESLLEGCENEEGETISFEGEMGWVEESGIYLRDWTEDTNVKVAFVNGEHVLCTNT